MKQSSLGLSNTVKRTRKREFLDAMELVVPWAELVSLIEPYAPESGRRGQQPFAVQTMLRIHFMQQWFKLSDPAMEEALHDVPAFRDFAGLSRWDEHIPSESSILRFRHLLERHKLAEQILATVNALLQAKGLQLKAGTVVDATVIAAPRSSSFELKRVPDIVKFEAQQQIPFPIEQVEWDYQTFQSKDSPDMGVGIFAITKERVLNWLGNFNAVGIPVHGLTLSPLAVYNAMAYDMQLKDDSPGTILMDIGTSATDLIIVENGRIWLRTIPIGGTHFTEALVRSLRSTSTSPKRWSAASSSRTPKPRRSSARRAPASMPGRSSRRCDRCSWTWSTKFRSRWVTTSRSTAKRT